MRTIRLVFEGDTESEVISKIRKYLDESNASQEQLPKPHTAQTKTQCPVCGGARLNEKRGIGKVSHKPYHNFTCPLCSYVQWLKP